MTSAEDLAVLRARQALREIGEETTRPVADDPEPQQLTRADLADMSPSAIVQAQRDGLLRDLLTGGDAA